MGETLTSAPTVAVITPIWSVMMTKTDFGNGDKGAVSYDRFADESGQFRMGRLWHSS